MNLKNRQTDKLIKISYNVLKTIKRKINYTSYKQILTNILLKNSHKFASPKTFKCKQKHIHHNHLVPIQGTSPLQQSYR